MIMCKEGMIAINLHAVNNIASKFVTENVGS